MFYLNLLVQIKLLDILIDQTVPLKKVGQGLK